jgi:hypothetical protein
MSLLNLVYKNVVIKFTDAAKSQFTSEVFRLTAVDGMGFLQIQDLKPGVHSGHETASEPYWINKDLIREIHEFDASKVKETARENGQGAKPKVEATVDQIRREVTPKPAKPKLPAKPKSVLKQKPFFN